MWNLKMVLFNRPTFLCRKRFPVLLIWTKKERQNEICSSFLPLLFLLSVESEEEGAEEFPQPRRFFHRICTHGYFDIGISAVIVLNVICMAIEHYKQPEVSHTLFYLHYSLSFRIPSYVLVGNKQDARPGSSAMTVPFQHVPSPLF